MRDTKLAPTYAKLVRLPAELGERITTWRHASRIASESEAIRRLLIMALERAERRIPRITK